MAGVYPCRSGPGLSGALAGLASAGGSRRGDGVQVPALVERLRDDAVASRARGRVKEEKPAATVRHADRLFEATRWSGRALQREDPFFEGGWARVPGTACRIRPAVWRTEAIIGSGASASAP